MKGCCGGKRGTHIRVFCSSSVGTPSGVGGPPQRAPIAPGAVTDAQVVALRQHGLTDMGIVQLTHIVSDFSSYNTLNLALDTDYDYRDFRRELPGFTASS